MSLFLREQAIERLLDSCAVGLKELRDAHERCAAGAKSKLRAPLALAQLGGFIFGLKRLRYKFAIRFLQQNFDAAFRFFQLLLAVA